jgi:hypothetical protein
MEAGKIGSACKAVESDRVVIDSLDCIQKEKNYARRETKDTTHARQSDQCSYMVLLSTPGRNFYPVIQLLLDRPLDFIGPNAR